MTLESELALVPDPNFAMILSGEPVPGEGFKVIDRSSGNAIWGAKSLKKWGLASSSVRLEPPLQSRTDPRFEPGETVMLVPERADHLPAVFGVWDDKGDVRIGTASSPRAVALAIRSEPLAGIILGVTTLGGAPGSRSGMVILIGARELLSGLRTP